MMTGFRGTVAVLLILSLSPGQVAGQRRLPIIDMHMHAHLPGGPLDAPSPCDPQPCSGVGRATTTGQETLRQTLAAMDRYNIVKGFLSGDLETLRTWSAAAPGRFVTSPFIYTAGNPSLETLRPEYAAGHLTGLGEVATQYAGVAPNDPALEPYFALAEKLDLPVLIHTLGFGAHNPNFRVAAGSPVLLEPVLVRHPKLRLYVENAGYPYLGEMVAMMYQYPQLHADLSTITWIIPRPAFHDYLRALVRAGLTSRLMFGSDQMRWPEVIGRAIEAIEQADFLTAEQRRAIFHDNAARFLHLQRSAP